ncbi:M23 family metallopeptidase [Polyangium spumosum]|uniref:Peptidoglycan DD-metalloendopeptidase family protein n=1 Tax=Polyangium spumosum TaxID=889282 RepID=A0A6N7PTJ4_9BACT|nr:M23 family metallopeptidase [Polyangium spumosum]MRG93750.1 peptidoglycan DD-metalloendopeptidase family protein [Polyangium spumosum]
MRVPVLIALALAVTACEVRGPSGSTADSTASPAGSAAPAASAEPAAAAAPASSASAAPSAAPAAASAEPPDAGSPDAAPVADPSRLTIEGRAVQGGLLRAKLDGKLKKMNFPGHRAIVSDEGEFLIVFGRNAPKQEKITITFDDGQVLERVFDVEQRTYETDKIDNLPKNMVELDMPTRVKLTQAEQKLDVVRKKYTKKSCFKEAFVWPSKGKVTSRYGQPRVLNGTDGGIHWGVDIAVPTGTPVRAPACGTVVFAEKNLPLSGDTLVIDHGQGLTSTFIHLSGFSAKVGDEVKQGQVVARVGMTGRTNGPHLDWRMNFFEVRIDPELLVAGAK